MTAVWRLNYFNYFTEVEEQFQRARGTGSFLLVAARLGAALSRGRTPEFRWKRCCAASRSAFDQWRTKKNKTQMVNSHRLLHPGRDEGGRVDGEEPAVRRSSRAGTGVPHRERARSPGEVARRAAAVHQATTKSLTRRQRACWRISNNTSPT